MKLLRSNLTAHYILNYFSEDHFVFANKFFPRGRDSDQQIGEGKCVKTGFEKNVRISADPSAGAHDKMAMLQIDGRK